MATFRPFNRPTQQRQKRFWPRLLSLVSLARGCSPGFCRVVVWLLISDLRDRGAVMNAGDLLPVLFARVQFWQGVDGR